MSDWFAVHDTVAPIKAGLDLEMPFPVFRGKRLLAKVEAGEVSEAEIDACTLRMLKIRAQTRSCQNEGPEKSEIREETAKIAREIAQNGMVLLKNEGGALPIKDGAAVALIGEFAKDPVITGGGSASCIPQYRHSPLEVLGKELQKVQFAKGVRTRRIIPAAPKEKTHASNGQPGVDIAIYNDDSPDEKVFSEVREDAALWMLGQFKPGVKVPGSHVRLTTTITTSSTGSHTLAVRCTGSFNLKVNGEQVLSGPTIPISTEQFIFNHILLEVRVELPMSENTPYEIELVMQGPSKLSTREPTPYAATIAFEEAYSEDDAIAEAVVIARSSDVSIIYAGRNGQYESEGFDLESIELPENQTRLVRAVAAESKKTVLVLHAGNPIDVSHVVDEVDAVLLAHFPGQEGAQAAADLLTGRKSPSGRLATTWFKTLEDAPSFNHFPPKKQEDGKVTIDYVEGVGVGYRASNLEGRVRWPFGHGLSYTSFAYSGLEVELIGNPEESKLKCSVRVKNTGQVEGKEVVQLYVTPAASVNVWRPERELKGFAKTGLLAPGAEELVVVEVPVDMACSYWVEKTRSWKLDPGKYGIIIGDQRSGFDIKEGRSWNHL